MVLKTFTHTRGQQPCKFIETKETVYVTKESKPHTSLGQQYGGRDVM